MSISLVVVVLVASADEDAGYLQGQSVVVWPSFLQPFSDWNNTEIKRRQRIGMIPEDVMVLTVGDQEDEEGSRPGVTVGSGGVIFSALLAAAEHLSGTPFVNSTAAGLE